ncbi:MAG: cysteine desulfurase-like protein [Bacteroidota bacterium]
MDQQHIIEQFPSLKRQVNGNDAIFLDGPAGTQVPQSVIDAISHYYQTSNANSHGLFATTQETDHLLDQTRAKVADFLGAEGPHCISWGANMTTLNFSLSRAIGRALQPGDEVLITQLDHEANRGPWLSLRELGIVVREVKLNLDGRLNYTDFQAKINERTRLIAMGYASNIFGTVNEVEQVRRWAHQVGAWLLLDAVHYAPHLPIDVQAIGCDFLLCSAYKFYGPHVGLLYSKPGLLDRLPTDRLRTAPQAAPDSIETGTANHAALAGVGACIDFIAGLGSGATYREQLRSGMDYIGGIERSNFAYFYEALKALPGVQVYGPALSARRAPTISIVVKGRSAAELCTELGQRGIFAWDGHFYAIRATEVLGLLEQGGVTRMGLAVYNTRAELERVVQIIDQLS